MSNQSPRNYQTCMRCLSCIRILYPGASPVLEKKTGILKNVKSPGDEIAFNMATECGRLLVLTELK